MNTSTRAKSGQQESLRAIFEQIIDLEAQKKGIAEAIDEIAGDACERFGVSKKAFKLALKYYAMSEGERTDFDAAIEFAAQALRDAQQADLFETGRDLGNVFPWKGERMQPCEPPVS